MSKRYFAKSGRRKTRAKCQVCGRYISLTEARLLRRHMIMPGRVCLGSWTQNFTDERRKDV
jgi:hypothetical protein